MIPFDRDLGNSVITLAVPNLRRVRSQFMAGHEKCSVRNVYTDVMRGTGEKGTGQSGKALHYKNSTFHRVIPQFMLQVRLRLFRSYPIVFYTFASGSMAL